MASSIEPSASTSMRKLPDEITLRISKLLLASDTERGIIISYSKHQGPRKAINTGPSHDHELNYTTDFWNDCPWIHTLFITSRFHYEPPVNQASCINLDLGLVCRDLSVIARDVIWSQNVVYMVDCCHVRRTLVNPTPTNSNLLAFLLALGPQSASKLQKMRIVLLLEDPPITFNTLTIMDSSSWIQYLVQKWGRRTLKKKKVTNPAMSNWIDKCFPDGKIPISIQVEVCTVKLKHGPVYMDLHEGHHTRDESVESVTAPVVHDLNLTWEILD